MKKTLKRTPLVIPDNWGGAARFYGLQIEQRFREIEEYLLETGAVADMVAGTGAVHNELYRGKNLGTLNAANIDSFATKHEIAAGKYTDLYLGDFFTIADGTYDYTWVVAHFGKDRIYLVMNPVGLANNDPFITTKWNSANNITSTGYKTSTINDYVVNTFVPVMAACLGDHLVATSYPVCSGINTTNYRVNGDVVTQKAIIIAAENYVNYRCGQPIDNSIDKNMYALFQKAKFSDVLDMTGFGGFMTRSVVSAGSPYTGAFNTGAVIALETTGNNDIILLTAETNTVVKLPVITIG